MPRADRTDGPTPIRREDGSKVGRVRESDIDPEEVARLRNEVERLRNDLFLARNENGRLRHEVRLETYQQLVEALGHELRTSLTLILGWTELLLGDKVAADKHGQAHDTIYAAGWRVEAALRALERVVERDVRSRAARAELAPDDQERPATSTRGGTDS